VIETPLPCPFLQAVQKPVIPLHGIAGFFASSFQTDPRPQLPTPAARLIFSATHDNEIIHAD